MAYFLVFKRLDQIPLGGLNERRYQIIIFTIFLLSIIFWPLFYFVSKKNKDAIIKINKTLEKRVEKQNIRLKKQNELLHYQVEHDGLTKLPNQTSLINRLKKNNFTTLLIVNLDDFRQLNDFYGTSIGDKVLALVASEFAQIENENITVYRMPSDEFAILIESSVEDYDAEIKSVLDRIKPSLNLKLKSLDQDVLIGLTIGIDSGRGLPLLAHADSALKRAKTSRKHYLFYDESINPSQHYQTNIEWIQKIKLALAENRIVAYYQPIIDNSTKQISKYEALVRLIDVDGTIVPPVKFLEIAKKSKLYHEITKCVLNQIILQFKDKKEEVSINISYNDIVDIATREFIVQTLEAQNGQAKIVFEILENDSIEDFEAVKSFVAEVKSHGAKVAIDDFGSGYSNFEVVFNLNVDYLKIDGTLIKNLDRSLNSKLIVETIVGFCKKLNIACIAEFVHSEEISKKVLDIGINFSQGYYFAQPMSPDDI
jgi:diguanylate cyclase (GGDEF)-like protein